MVLTTAGPSLTLALFVGFISAAFLSTGVVSHPDVAGCQGKKIAILDIGDLAERGNFPKCDVDKNVQVNFANGVPYSRNHSIDNSSRHLFGVNASPWFLAKAIRESRYFTESMEEADIIFVYDYCYYITWLADVHSYGRDHEDGPGDDLLQAYKTMMELPEWKKNNGAKFAFFDSHCGFMAGKAQGPVQDMKCSTFKNSIHIIVDTPMRNICDDYWEIKKIIIAPYVPTILETTNFEANLHQPFVAAEDRPLMGYSRARCEPTSEETGMRLRYWFSFVEWGKNPEMDVRCTDHELNPEGFQDFQGMFQKMRQSKFCPAFPGDAQSSRRLSEAFVAGCIPLFLGPPYHTMPIGDQVPWAKLGLFFDIKNNSMWMKPGVKSEWKLHPTIRSVHETEARWWVPDVDMPRSKYIEVEHPSEVMNHLTRITRRQLNKMLMQVHAAAPKFSYVPKFTDPPNAINSIVSAMCSKQDQFPPQNVA